MGFRVHIRIPAEEGVSEVLRILRSILNRHPGDEPVFLHLRDRNQTEVILELPMRVRYTGDFEDAIKAWVSAIPQFNQ